MIFNTLQIIETCLSDLTLIANCVSRHSRLSKPVIVNTIFSNIFKFYSLHIFHVLYRYNIRAVKLYIVYFYISS